jgi:hypothetical protein
LFVAKQNCFKPKRVVTDFEVAIHKAVGNIWPNVTVIGCKFHFTQSWFRKILTLGLISEYRNRDSKIGKLLRLFFGHHYLKSSNVGDVLVFDLFNMI